MGTAAEITCLFVDIGGVLLTDGWPHAARALASRKFDLHLDEWESRHHEAFETYEMGKLSLDDYLTRVVFYTDRSFSSAQFKEFMFAQTQPFPNMIELVRKLKAKYGLKIVVVSNEAREINAYRIRTFKLNEFVDVFISSCFVRLRKPDADIFRLALDVVQTPASQIVYIENTPMFVQIAESLGLQSILHTDYNTTRSKLAEFGLRSQDEIVQ